VLARIAQADVITEWNEAALIAIKTANTPPPKAARALAILHTAIYDAVNGITQTHERYIVPGKPAGVASPEVAASAAAHFVLVRLFPAQRESFDAAYQRALTAFPNSQEKNNGVHWGEWVANIIVVARSTDDSETVVPYVPKNIPGEWVPTPTKNAPGLLPHWANVTCFAMSSGSQFRPSMTPVISSAVYAFDLNLTKQLGGKESALRTAEQTQIAYFWADGPGTVTPPGHWNQIARDVAIQRGNTVEQNARLFALLNIAQADAAILCWDCKYFVKYWRPVTAIRNAETDNNPATEKDPAWTPLLDTPPFPEYTSGHSTFSGAAATVLAAFFGSDNLAFTASSEATQGFVRKYHSFSEAAAEAGMSRIFGGIHFMSANQQGLASGSKLGLFVMENFLKEKRPLALLQPVAGQRAGKETSPAPLAVAPLADPTPPSPSVSATLPPASLVPGATRSIPPASVASLPPFPAAIPPTKRDPSPAGEIIIRRSGSPSPQPRPATPAAAPSNQRP
jgi:hypothetical protein